MEKRDNSKEEMEKVSVSLVLLIVIIAMVAMWTPSALLAGIIVLFFAILAGGVAGDYTGKIPLTTIFFLFLILGLIAPTEKRVQVVVNRERVEEISSS